MWRCFGSHDARFLHQFSGFLLILKERLLQEFRLHMPHFVQRSAMQQRLLGLHILLDPLGHEGCDFAAQIGKASASKWTSRP